MTDRNDTLIINRLVNKKNYPMEILNANIRIEKNSTVSKKDNSTVSNKPLDVDLYFPDRIIGSFSEFAEKVDYIISEEYWDQYESDLKETEEHMQRQIDYNYYSGKYFELSSDLGSNQAFISAKLRDVGIDSDWNIFVEVTVLVPEDNLLINYI